MCITATPCVSQQVHLLLAAYVFSSCIEGHVPWLTMPGTPEFCLVVHCLQAERNVNSD